MADIPGYLITCLNTGKLALLAILVSGGVVLHILACVLYNNWWPMLAGSIFPKSGRDNALAPLDYVTPAKFDNNYFHNIKQGQGLLISDNVLVSQDIEGEIREHVWAYASDEELLFDSFANSMIKTGNIHVLTGEQGEIRKSCRFVNT